MKKADVEIGGKYWAKVSGRVVVVRIMRSHPTRGWHALNLTTHKIIHIKTAARLRGLAPNEREGYAPRSQLTLEETMKLAAVRAKKAERHQPTKG